MTVVVVPTVMVCVFLFGSIKTVNGTNNILSTENWISVLFSSVIFSPDPKKVRSLGPAVEVGGRVSSVGSGLVGSVVGGSAIGGATDADIFKACAWQ